MRILAISLKDYRGIRDRRVEFPRDGVTILEGPNETGKSSLAEALHLVLHVFDGTTAQKWLAIRPAGQDVPTEVEIEIETGPYRFRYRKCFFRKRQTSLLIQAPRTEELRGREAHERVLAMLKETIDYDLWQALQVQQGGGVVQPDLDRKPSLVRALGSVAGSTRDESGLDLFRAVQEEYARYYTEDRGQARKSLQQKYLRVEEAASEARRCDEELERLQRDIDRVAELDAELSRLEAERARAEQNAERRERELSAISKNRTELDRLELACRRASMEESMARKQAAERTELGAGLERATRQRVQVEASAARDEPAFEDIKHRLRNDRLRKEQAEERIRAADDLVQLRERDANFRRGEIDLGQLTMRRDRVQEARTEAETARAFLQSVAVDDAALKAIRERSYALERAQAQLDAGSPQLRVRALRDGVELDGEALAPDRLVERNVAERMRVTAEGVVEVEVTAGTSVEELAAARDRVRDELKSLLARAGVPDLESAELMNQRRKEAERIVERTERVIAEYLGDLDLDRLCGKVETTRQYVERYPAERPQVPEIEPDFDAAVAAKRKARRVLELARTEQQEAVAGYSATDEAWQEMRRKVYETTERVRRAVEEERQAKAALVAARAEAGDEEVEQSLRIALQGRDAAERAYAAARQQYDAHEPDRLKELAENARRTVAGTTRRAAGAREERTRLAGGLEARGRDGLYERREEARTRLKHAELELRALERRAEAAKRLYETMRLARETAQRSYVGPLRERIVELGRLVFGGGFDVELDEELRIATRSLDGISLPFEDLSGGAKEQLGLLARVAAALTVDPAEGAPLIFDDTFVYTDPERLEGMGAVLSKAGERCQIIVLTCQPDRFRHVGGAHVISL